MMWTRNEHIKVAMELMTLNESLVSLKGRTSGEALAQVDVMVDALHELRHLLEETALRDHGDSYWHGPFRYFGGDDHRPQGLQPQGEVALKAARLIEEAAPLLAQYRAKMDQAFELALAADAGEGMLRA